MVFSSLFYIFCFLPVAVIVYTQLCRYRHATASKVWLVAMSFLFYSFGIASHVIILSGSAVFNYAVSLCLTNRRRWSLPLLVVGIGFNLLLIGYYKYYAFLLTNISYVFPADLAIPDTILLPLGISFFTFQQIAYLVDAYKGDAVQGAFLDYLLFVTFFPQLVAGPIVHHREMLPQFHDNVGIRIDWDNMASGIVLFSIGLFKKAVIADTFAPWVDIAFNAPKDILFLSAWLGSLSYTFQIYFDFSGYTDMALGAALLFNVKLPTNFFSPYKSCSIQEFWRRWHITLSRWLLAYLYIPLGGNRKSNGRTLLNLMITFFLGGLWHGAQWTFVLWGVLHGLALILHRLYRLSGRMMPVRLGWCLTFAYVHLCWIFFRAESVQDAWFMIRGLVGLNGMESFNALQPFKAGLPLWLQTWLRQDFVLDINLWQSSALILASFLIVLAFPSSMEIRDKVTTVWQTGKIRLAILGATVFTFYASVVTMIYKNANSFIYFNF